MELGNFSNLEGDQARSVKELEEWLKKGGARFDCLKVVNFREGYRGVIATRDIQKKERLVSIPRSQLMTLEQARMSKIWQQAGTQEFVSPKHTCLAVFLLEQSRLRDLSQWWNYISILPEDHSSFPINYSTQQLTELLGSPLLLQIHQKVVDLKTDYDRLALASPLFSSYSFKEFCWGRTMVGSRMFGVYIDGVKTNILAPFADMLNHRLPKQTVWNYLQNEDSFIIQSLGDLPAGCEVFDSYGRKCNSRYLLNYGFVVLDNPQNQICLRLNIAGALKEKKLQMLKRAEFVKILRISKNLNDNNFYEAMGFLRFATINNPNHLAVLEKISGIHHNQEPYLPAKTPPINVELQIEVWKALGTLCLDNLSEYPRSLQEDEERLQQSSLSNNMRNILTIIIGEKRLSKFYISLCKEVVKVLEQGYVSAFHQIVANPQEPWANYLFKILSIMPNERKKEVMHLTLQTAAEQVETLGEQEQLEP